MWALVAGAPGVSGVIARGLGRAEPDIDRDAGGPKFRVALPGDFRIGILDRRDHARDAGGDDGVSAGRRLAKMRAWLERRVERGAARSFAGGLERLGVGGRAGARV